MTLLLKYNWRITKYNPEFRNEKGVFLKDEWTSFSDIGKTFDENILTFEEYRKTEDAYVSTALYFLSEANLNKLTVTSLENRNLPKIKKSEYQDIDFNPQFIKNRTSISDKLIEDTCRFVLREFIWCRLESETGFYIHFGYDYYMYIGSSVRSNQAIVFGKENNLFIEEMVSPYISNSSK